MAHLAFKTLFLTGVAGVALAQTPLTFDPGDGSHSVVIGPPQVEEVPGPTPAMEGSGGFSPLSPIPMHLEEATEMQHQLPALIESSGTWMRRGLWYADVDAVVMARTWDRSGITFIEEFDSLDQQVAGNNDAFIINSLVTIQAHDIGESSPGYDGSGRLALGRFLFRDQENRDHMFEMVIFGGSEWTEQIGAEAQLTEPGQGIDTAFGRNQQGLHVPRSVDGSTPINIDDILSFASFDRANAMEIEYSSRFHSWEWNYSVTQRMRKDRMELQPNGEWIRRASPGVTWEYLAGFRYFDVEEQFDWTATEIASIDPDLDATDEVNTDGRYDIDTSNNLFGLQLGAGVTYDSDRWNVTVSTKQGFYVNDARATSRLTYTDPDEDDANAVALNNYYIDLHENSVSYLATGSIIGRYYLRPNVSLRAGWEFMYVTGLALAPSQVDFNPAANQLHLTGDALYHGISFGTECYW